MFEKPKSTETPINKPYRKLQVDDLPIVETYEKLDYKELLQDHLVAKGKPLKLVKRHAKSTPVPTTTKCPKCGAPSEYLYANNGAKGQYQCKVCTCLFSEKNRYLKEAILKCPHCSKSLEKVKKRKDFDVYKWVPFALVKQLLNHWRVCQERLRQPSTYLRVKQLQFTVFFS